MSEKLKVGILGGTGMVGQRFISLLENHPWFEVAAIAASPRSAGKTYEEAVGGRWKMDTPMPEAVKNLIVLNVNDVEHVASQVDFVFSAVDMTKDEIRAIEEAYAKTETPVVSNNSAHRWTPDVPMVIPEINPEDVRRHKGIIANPNCTTIVSLVAINALNHDSPIESIVASSYQAVSGAGAGGPIELMDEVELLREGKPVEPKVFQYQIAYNVIPQIGGEAFEGYTSEEMKMQNEGRKIMHLPELKVSCTCVRVPVVRSHSVSIVVRTREKISVERARQLIAAAPGCRLVDDLANKRYPMPLETSDQDLVFVGRIRDDLTSDNGLNIWCCGDQVRKGAATNAVQIAQLLIAE